MCYTSIETFYFTSFAFVLKNQIHSVSDIHFSLWSIMSCEFCIIDFSLNFYLIIFYFACKVLIHEFHLLKYNNSNNMDNLTQDIITKWTLFCKLFLSCFQMSFYKIFIIITGERQNEISSPLVILREKAEN